MEEKNTILIIVLIFLALFILSGGLFGSRMMSGYEMHYGFNRMCSTLGGLWCYWPAYSLFSIIQILLIVILILLIILLIKKINSSERKK